MSTHRTNSRSRPVRHDGQAQQATRPHDTTQKQLYEALEEALYGQDPIAPPEALSRKVLLRLIHTYNKNQKDDSNEIRFENPTEGDVVFMAALEDFEIDAGKLRLLETSLKTAMKKFEHASIEERKVVKGRLAAGQNLFEDCKEIHQSIWEALKRDTEKNEEIFLELMKAGVGNSIMAIVWEFAEGANWELSDGKRNRRRRSGMETASGAGKVLEGLKDFSLQVLRWYGHWHARNLREEVDGRVVDALDKLVSLERPNPQTTRREMKPVKEEYQHCRDWGDRSEFTAMVLGRYYSEVRLQSVAVDIEVLEAARKLLDVEIKVENLEQEVEDEREGMIYIPAQEKSIQIMEGKNEVEELLLNPLNENERKTRRVKLKDKMKIWRRSLQNDESVGFGDVLDSVNKEGAPRAPIADQVQEGPVSAENLQDQFGSHFNSSRISVKRKWSLRQWLSHRS